MDKIDDKTWRLEVMPDVVLTKDPFARPSLTRKVGEIIYNEREIAVNLASLSDKFKYRGLSENKMGTANNNTIKVSPGVYLLSDDDASLQKFNGDEAYGDGTKIIGEYVAPKASVQERTIVHTPTPYAKCGDDVTIKATVLGEDVDSVLIYPSRVSFWRADNHLIKMHNCGYQEWKANVNVGNRPYSYNIVAYYKDGAVTYPVGVSGTPLDWDYSNEDKPYTINVYHEDDAVKLLVAKQDNDGASFSALADGWRGARFTYQQRSPMAQDLYAFEISSNADASVAILSKDVSDILSNRNLNTVKINLGEVKGFKNLYIGFVTKDGFTFKADLRQNCGVQSFNVRDFSLTETINPRNVYPLFISRVFKPQPTVNASFKLSDVDRMVIVGEREDRDAYAEIYGVTVEK